MRNLFTDILRKWARLTQHSLFKTGVYTAFLKISSQLVVLASGIIVARFLGPHHYGIYAFAMAVVGVFILISQLGFTTYSIKLIATYESARDWIGLRSYILFSVSFVLVGSSVIAGICFIYFSTVSSHPNARVLQIALMLIPISAIFRVFQSYMNGFQFIRQGETIVLIRQFIFVISCLLILWMGIPDFSPVVVLCVQAASTAIAVFLLAVYMLNNTAVQLRETKGYVHSNTWLPGAVSFIMLSMMNYINTQTDTLMLGIFRESSEVAYYRVASQAAMLVGFASQIVILLIAPKIAQLHAKGSIAELQRLITYSTQVMLAFALLVSAFLVVFSTGLISLLFGDAYLDARSPLLVLCIGKVVISLFGCAAIVLNMCGYEKSTTKILIVSASLNILLNYLLVPEYGAYGAALATTLVVSLSSVLMFQKIRQATGLNAFGLNIKFS